MIIDTFTFFNEKDILKIRFQELYDIVDYFVLVEGSKTQSLNNKPFYFEESKCEFAEFLDKVIHIKVEDMPQMDSAWSYDIFQRDCIARGLSQLSLTNEDIIMISDLDEIPNKELVKILPYNLGQISCFEMDYYVYYLNLRVKNFKWRGTVAVRGEIAKTYSTHSLIKARDNMPDQGIIKDGGAHLGYQGGEDMIYHKYFSCVEPFDKINGIPGKEIFSEVFKERARDGGSFIFCDDLSKRNLLLEKTDLPFQSIKNNIELYKNLIKQ